MLFVLAFLLSLSSASQLFDFETDFGGIPDNNDFSTCEHNSARLQEALNANVSGNVLRFVANQTYSFHHGVLAEGLHDAVLQIDGTLRFERSDLDVDNQHPFPACLAIVDGNNITVTSTGTSRGIIDGQGSQWWGIPLIGFLETAENRPRLLRFNTTRNLLIEKIVLKDSPYHTLYLDSVHEVEVRNISIVARRTDQDGHSWVDLTAFNTDGIDVSGTNVHIHDVDIWVQDDCIAVKDVKQPHEAAVSANMTFERINATGLGFVVGSILGTHVHNITFLNSYLYKPLKGIYLKFGKRDGFTRSMNRYALVEDIKYVNITMVAPQQWPIWMGPAQQADNRNPCHANPCSLCWPMTPGSKCNTVPHQRMRNITLRNVQIHNPKMSTGVLLGSHLDPLENVLFEDVRVTQGVPPLIARRPLAESFPGTVLPVHDPYVPPEYANRIQRQIAGLYGTVVKIITTVGNFVRNIVEHMHLALLWRILKTDEVQAWYWSYLAQAFLNTVWVWIVLSIGFAVAGVLSFRGWMRYRKRQRVRRDAQSIDPNDNVNGTEEINNDGELISDASLDEWLLHHPRVETRWPPLLCNIGYILLLALCWGGAIYTGTFPFRKPTWERTYRYFACKSVVNGIAKGSTWPVPQCFTKERPPWWHGGDDNDKNETSHHHHHHPDRHGSDHWSPHQVDIDVERIVITGSLALAILAIAFWKHWQEQRAQRNRPDSNTGVPEYSPIPSFVTVEACDDLNHDADPVERSSPTSEETGEHEDPLPFPDAEES